MAVTYSIDQSDIREMGKAFDEIRKVVGSVKKAQFNKAAKPYIYAVRALAPKADKIVKRYDTPKLSGKIRAPKGSGRVVARYYPGNLGRSFKALKLRRVKNATFIGPERLRGDKARGTFGASKADGYYAHIVEGRSPFVRAAWMNSRGRVLRNIEKIYKKKIKKAERKLNKRKR